MVENELCRVDDGPDEIFGGCPAAFFLVLVFLFVLVVPIKFFDLCALGLGGASGPGCPASRGDGFRGGFRGDGAVRLRRVQVFVQRACLGGWTAAQAIRTPQFALMLVCGVAYSVPWNTVVPHLPLHMLDVGYTEAVAIERCVAGINDVLGHAEKRGVFLALENHGGITSTPAQMMKIIQGVRDSKFFGVNFDGGNFRSDDPYRDMAVIAPYAINAQVKVSIFRNGKKEPADLKRVIGILRDADYRGYIVLEYEEKDPLGEIPGYLGQLRQLIS